METAIETRGLSKRFRKRTAVHPIDLVVPSGSLFGYLGPNGAGKTTTIRMLLGLARPTNGSAQLLGQDVPGGLARVRKRIGSVLEDPAFYPKLTGRQNLHVLSTLSSDESAPSRIGSLLERVGLADRADDRVRTYSHGMRQRLGLAAALLHDPELIILDEPATALDPAGIRDVRALLESLKEQGKTVFLSSHLLSEVEQLCDQVAVVSKGALAYQGSLAGLTAGVGRVRVRIDNIERAERVATDLGWSLTRTEDGLLVDNVPAREVNRQLAVHGLFAHGLSEESKKLEDVFLQLTEERPPDA